jgi:uncharacterized membrane protein
MSSQTRDRALRVGVHHVLLAGVCMSGALMALGLLAGGPLGAQALRAGIIVMITTPIRVLLLVVGFALERDWLFSAISAAVLVMLVAGAFLGARH